MPNLIEAQRQVAAALRDGAAAARAASLFSSDEAVAIRRLAVYRGNVVAALARALRGAYPVVHQIVGEEFFNGLARAYWQAHPSRSGDLHDFGDSFGDFIADFAPAAELPYLADMARLEWLVHRAACCADSAPLDRARLASVAAPERGQLQFAFLPGTAVLESSHPIVRIWTIHQSNFSGEFAVDWDARETACVARRGLEVKVWPLAPQQAIVYRRIMEGDPLGQALACALQEAEETDPVSLLSEFLADAPLADFSIPTNPS